MLSDGNIASHCWFQISFVSALVSNINNDFYAILKNWRSAHTDTHINMYIYWLVSWFLFSFFLDVRWISSSMWNSRFSKSQNKLHNIPFSHCCFFSLIERVRMEFVHGMHEITVWLYRSHGKPHHSWFCSHLHFWRDKILRWKTAKSPRDWKLLFEAGSKPFTYFSLYFLPKHLPIGNSSRKSTDFIFYFSLYSFIFGLSCIDMPSIFSPLVVHKFYSANFSHFYHFSWLNENKHDQNHG